MSYDHQTSGVAYQEVKNNDFRCQQVLIAIRKLKKCTDKQIAAYLGLEINKVTGRRCELVDKGLVESVGKFPDPVSNRPVNFWREKVKQNLLQAELFN